MNRKIGFIGAAGLFLGTAAAHAQFTPIALAPGSFNQDVVVEATAYRARPLMATTATMDQGTNNTEATWYEIGYNDFDAPDTGLPAPGTTIQSFTLPDHSFTFASSYTEPNAILVDTNTPTGSFQLTSPTAVNSLSFLTAAGKGSPTLAVTIHYADGSTEAATIVTPDWFGGETTAFTANGRVDAVTGGFSAVYTENPRIFSVDLPLGNTSSPVTRIDFDASAIADDAHAAIFAVSGAQTAGGEFTPLAVTGYNQDIIVEATAFRPPASVGATTATLDRGIQNTEWTWYAQGYNTNAPTTGLPAPGSTITNTALDHIYKFPASYTELNAALVDADNFASIIPEVPNAYTALSFLASSGEGALTAAYFITHADSSFQSGSIVIPDWFGGANPAFVAGGRVNVGNGALGNVNSQDPRLYSIDLPLDNTTSPVTQIDLSWEQGGHGAIFAVSGATAAGAPTVVQQATNLTVFQGAQAQFSVSATGDEPITYQWQVGTNNTFVNLTNGAGISGATSGTLTIEAAAFSNQASYRLVASNAEGGTSSLPVTLTVLSTAEDVTSPGDVVTLVGGTTPENEPVANTIDNTTTKHLNFGTDGDTAAPFTPPVGFTVTPALGADTFGTVVTAVRFYTANDAVDRDPSEYTLEGSNDGENFTQITSGELALPIQRNAAGLELTPLTQGVYEARFNNSIPYKTYRLMFVDVKNATAANAVQIGEIELLGTVATSAVTSLTASLSETGDLVITSSSPGTLQSTTELRDSGTQWTEVGPIDGSTTVETTGRARFFRVIGE